MSRLQRGIYFDVCLHNWDKGEPLSRAEQVLVFSDLDGWTPTVNALVDAGKLKRTKGGGLYSDRALIEARSSADRLSIAKAAGAAGGRKSQENKRKNQSDPPRVARPNQNQNQNQKTPIPPAGAEPDFFGDDAPPEPNGESYTAPFEAWWAVYPNKTGKGAASTAYERAFKRLGGAKAGTAKIHAKLRTSIEAQAKVWKRKGVDGRFIPNPATWLNQSRWSDAEVERELEKGAAGRPAAPPDNELAPAAPEPAKPSCSGCGMPYGAPHGTGCEVLRGLLARGWTPEDA